MRFRLAAVLCLTGAAACSHNNPDTATADEVNQTNVARSEPDMTPASLETPRAAEPVAATPTNPTPSTSEGPSDVRAPLVADTKGTSSNAYKAEPAPSNGATPPPGTQPDNTKVNERDKSPSALTPMDQRNNETDLKITQQVRQAVMADGSLSFTAKNVKIITQAGKVTLRGPVKTAAERDAIDAAARKVAGATQVDNQIEVKK
jgi:hypothetical protein